MKSDDFNSAQARIASSRRQFCEKLGIARRTGDAYALGRAPVPLTVQLAIAALDAGLSPAGGAEKKSTA